VIEQIIAQLKDLFRRERHRAKALGGLLARLTAKVVACACGPALNRRHGRPLRHLATLLIS
jgi:hypothetical protein